MKRYAKLNTTFIILFIFLFFVNCHKERENPKKETIKKFSNTKKIIFVNSYHQGYEWSDQIERSFLKFFNAKELKPLSFFSSNYNLNIKFLRMNTKLRQEIWFKKKAALKIHNFIKSWKPDLIVTSDDNAAKYLIVPYYKNSRIPVIFCGVNFDATVYGFPAKNITGMIEVQLIKSMIENLKRLKNLDKIAYLASSTETSVKEWQNFKKYTGEKITPKYVSTLEKWKDDYKQLQKENYLVLLGTMSTLPGWENQKDEIKRFVYDNTSSPTVNWDKWLKDYALFTLATVPEEQGKWVASTTLDILNGKKVSEIPLVTNKQSNLFLNHSLAKKINISFTKEQLQRDQSSHDNKNKEN